jgi:hypothetical protein
LQIYKPTLWYFERLLFLVEHAEVREGFDSLFQQTEGRPTTSQDSQSSSSSGHVEETELEMESQFDSIQTQGDLIEEFNVLEEGILSPVPVSVTNSTSTPSGSHYRNVNARAKKRREDDTIVQEATSVLKSLATKFKTPQEHAAPPPNETDDEIFAKYIISKLKQITDRDIRLDLELEINKLIFQSIVKYREQNK